MYSKSRFSRLLLVLILGVTHGVFACQVPVFRYALERWETDLFQLYLVAPDKLNAEQEELESRVLEAEKTANFKLTSIVLNELTEQQRWKLPDIDTSIQEPRLILFPPSKTADTRAITNLPFNEVSFNSLLHSPCRKKVIDNLLSGSSCVWLVVHNNAPESAAKVREQLDRYLRKAEGKITLPEGIVSADNRHQITEKTDLDDVLRSSIPLKISFASVILDVNTPSEIAFVDTLFHQLPQQIRQVNEPLIIPIFGRGRHLAPLPSSILSFATVFKGCEYLTGACSCQVKEQNPGTDLLIQEDWKKYLTEGLAIIEKELPPLSGVTELTPPSPPISPKASTLNTSETENQSNQSNQGTNPYFITIAVLLLIVMVSSTFFILRKKS